MVPLLAAIIGVDFSERTASSTGCTLKQIPDSVRLRSDTRPWTVRLPVGWPHHERVDRECGVYSGATEQAYRREHHHETPENQRPIGGRQGYQDLVQISDLKPYVSLEGLRNIQRLIKIQNPPIGNVKLE
jgi:hypothetical protein